MFFWSCFQKTLDLVGAQLYWTNAPASVLACRKTPLASRFPLQYYGKKTLCAPLSASLEFHNFHRDGLRVPEINSLWCHKGPSTTTVPLSLPEKTTSQLSRFQVSIWTASKRLFVQEAKTAFILKKTKQRAKCAVAIRWNLHTVN